MKRYALLVEADRLGIGDLPVYNISMDWPFPVWSVSTDGYTIIQIHPIGERVFVGTFNISGSKKEIRDKIQSMLTRLVLKAGFAGRATIAIRADYVIQSEFTDDHTNHILEIGILFTADMDDNKGYGTVRWNAPNFWKPEGFPEIEAASQQLQDGLVVAEVMHS